MTDSRAIAVDACVAINLVATGRWAEVFAACELGPILATQAARESLWILDDDRERQAIDVHALAADGLVEIWTPVDDELTTLIELASTLGDGEAACLAIAAQRGIALATDDRAARREAGLRGLSGGLHSTATLLRTWHARRRPSDAELGYALRRVRDGARYVPPDDDPHAGWWHQHDSDGTDY